MSTGVKGQEGTMRDEGLRTTVAEGTYGSPWDTPVASRQAMVGKSKKPQVSPHQGLPIPFLSHSWPL